MKTKLLIISLLSIYLLSGCNRLDSVNEVPEGQYAQGFVLSRTDDGTMIRIFSPWEAGKVRAELTVQDDQPYCRLATNSATQAGFIHALGADSLVAGYCSPHLIYSKRAGAMDLGSDLSLDAERILRANADIVLLSTYQQDDKNAEVLRKIGTPVIPINEWTEVHPLARAEWIRVIGVLVGKQAEADSIFREVKAHYEALAAQPKQAERLSVVSGGTWQGTWYVPSGRTYMAQLFRDAGLAYRYEADSTKGSLPLSFEQALLDFKDADIWVGAPAKSLDELQQIDSKHSWFKAFKNGRVYNLYKRTTPEGGNDFWETGVVRPDLVLQDFISIAKGQTDSLYFASALH